LPLSSAPDQVLLLKKFQQIWSLIDLKKHRTGTELDEIVDTVKQNILKFAQNQLLGESMRDDLREFIELSITRLDVPVTIQAYSIRRERPSSDVCLRSRHLSESPV
jgi:hypothetical protein